MYKQAFELTLKSMKNYIDSAKRLYDSIPDKEMFKYSYDEIMEYEVVVKEYSKYDRETLNQIIMNHIDEDSSELEDLYNDFADEVEDYVDEMHTEEDEEEEFWNDPVMVYEAAKRNQKIIDNMFNNNNE
jgi:nucleoside diphosphate kinase